MVLIFVAICTVIQCFMVNRDAKHIFLNMKYLIIFVIKIELIS